MRSLNNTPLARDVRDGGEGRRTAAERARSKVCSLGLELCTCPGAESPEVRVILGFGKRTQQLLLTLPTWLVMRILQVNISRLQNSSFPGCGQVVLYGMSAALFGFLWVSSASSEEANIIFTSNLPFAACIALQSGGSIRCLESHVGSERCRGEHLSAWDDSVQVAGSQAEFLGTSDPACSRVLPHCRVSLLPDSVSSRSPSSWKCQILALW